MMKDFKIVMQLVLLISLITVSIYTIKFFVKNDMWIDFQDCGQVVGASSEEVPIKHGTQTELYLLIQYEKQGFKAQEVGATTYFQYKDSIGKRLCFEQTQRNPIMEKPYSFAKFFLGAIFSVIYFFILLIIFINWCLGDEE